MIDVTSRFRGPQAERGFGLRAARAKKVSKMKPFWRARVRGAQLRILSPQGPLSKEILLIKHVSLRQLQKRFGSSQISVAGPSLAA